MDIVSYRNEADKRHMTYTTVNGTRNKRNDRKQSSKL